MSILPNGTPGASLVEKAAESATLILVSRLSAIIGPAVAGFLFLQVWNGVDSLQRGQNALAVQMGTVSTKVENNIARLDRIERQQDERRVP